MISCDGIRARVGNFEIRDVSFTVPAGSHAILAGPTAAGKTTLLAIVAGAIPPLAGKVRIDGTDVTSEPPERRGVGFVPQHGFLFPHLSAGRNVDYGAREKGVVTRLALRFGIEHLMDRSVSALSGGERQLVALCRALAPRPSVLLLDEPFSALDARSREMTVRQFDALQTEWGFTVLHVTHEERETEFAAMTLVMADGKVTVRGKGKG